MQPRLECYRLPQSRAPLGKTGAHLGILGQALAQTVQTLGDLLSWVTRHVLCTRVDLDAWNDSRIGDGLDKGVPSFFC